jgi:hypothetical protein
MILTITLMDHFECHPILIWYVWYSWHLFQTLFLPLGHEFKNPITLFSFCDEYVQILVES